MRTEFDFSLLFRSSVGFDQMLDALRSAMQVGHIETYPPCDIERRSEDAYRVTLAVVGFRPDELTVTTHPNLLVVSGERRARGGAANDNEEHRRLLHRGIATRSFLRRFNLAGHIQVAGPTLADGLLTIELKREVPEAMRPRRIEIATGGTVQRPQPVEGQQAA